MSGYRDEEYITENDKRHERWHSPGLHVKIATTEKVKDARDNPVNEQEVGRPSYLPKET